MPTPICCPISALDTIMRLATVPARPELTCLLVSDQHRCLGSLVVTNTPRDLPGIIDRLTPVLLRLPEATAVVLALAVPDSGVAPTTDEHVSFLDAREHLAVIGVDLIDWFLLADGLATSLAEATDAASKWPIAPCLSD